jgi:hypothetical protein
MSNLLSDEPLPSWFRPNTKRAWKAHKRRQWKAVNKALTDFQLGCAYTPAYDLTTDLFIDAIEKLFKTMDEKISARVWGR